VKRSSSSQRAKSPPGSDPAVFAGVLIIVLVSGYLVWNSADPGVFLLWVIASVFGFWSLRMIRTPAHGKTLAVLFLMGALIHMSFSYLTYALFLDDLWGISSSVGDYIYQALVICVVGFFAMMAGLSWHHSRPRLPAGTEGLATSHATEETILRRGYLIALLATLMAAYVYWRVGFLPLFTRDPNAVRYFDDTVSSTYQADYSIFRRSVALFSVMLPFFWTIWKERRNLLALSCCVVGFIVLVGSGQRIQLAIAILPVLVMRCARGELRWKYVVGGLGFGIIFIVFTQRLLLQNYHTLAELGVLGGLATVFSEIRDLGWVLAKSGAELLYGKTYLAALIPIPKSIVPYKQLYALTEVTKSLIGMADVDSFAGLRIMAFGEAFINFSYWGVVALGFFIGRLLGWLSMRLEALGGARKDGLSLYPVALLWTRFAVQVYFGGSMALMDVILALIILAFLYGPTGLFRKFRNFSLSRPCPSASLATN
jgi:oligosaccharide repeat unit polymerase